MQGQFSIFDSGKREAPHEYPFRRYIGQKVIFTNPHHSLFGYFGEVVEILPYYTIIQANGRRYAATPYDLQEAKEK